MVASVSVSPFVHSLTDHDSLVTILSSLSRDSGQTPSLVYLLKVCLNHGCLVFVLADSSRLSERCKQTFHSSISSI